jgi:hypothetical protein
MMKMVISRLAPLCVGVVCFAACFSSVPSAAQAALVQYWRLDDGVGTTAANEVGGNTGTLVPGPTPTWTNTGLYPPLTTRTFLPSTYALDFEASTNDHMDGGNLGLVANGSGGQATVALWIKAESLTGDDRLWGQLTGATSQGGAVHFVSGGSAEVWTGGTWLPVAGSSGAATVGTWNHLAFVWTNNSMQFYLNGTAGGSVTSNFDFGGANGNFGLAAKFINTFGNAFDGVIDDVAIWNEALTGAQVALLAAGESPLPPPPAPEPGSLMLLGLGCVFAARKVRRQRVTH